MFGKTAKQWKEENPTVIRKYERCCNADQLLVLANLESYNDVLINQGKNQKERMELLRKLAVQQLQTLETVSLNNLPKLGVDFHNRQITTRSLFSISKEAKVNGEVL